MIDHTETPQPPADATADGAITAAQQAALAAHGITPPGQTPPLRAIDRIAGAFAAKLWSITVPEWDGLTIYFSPLTTADVQIVEANLKESEDVHERNIRLLLHKARDENGRPMFSQGDALRLKNEARWDVVNRVAAFMYRCGSLSPDEAKAELGNASSSATTSPSPSVSA